MSLPFTMAEAMENVDFFKRKFTANKTKETRRKGGDFGYGDWLVGGGADG